MEAKHRLHPLTLPELPVEVNNCVRGILQGFAQPTLNMVKNLVAIEQEHINLGHPDFVQVTKSVSASDDESDAGKQQAMADDREHGSYTPHLHSPLQ